MSMNVPEASEFERLKLRVRKLEIEAELMTQRDALISGGLCELREELADVSAALRRYEETKP